MVYFVLSLANFVTLSVNLNYVLVLNGTNFKDWKENVVIVLGCMDLDLTLRTEQPPSSTDSSSFEEKKFYENWEHSNRKSLMIIKHSIPKTFRGVVSKRLPMPNYSSLRLKNALLKAIRWK